MIALTEIKGYAMIQFSYMILRLYDQGNFTMETELARRKFETQANEKLIALKGIYGISKPDYFRPAITWGPWQAL